MIPNLGAFDVIMAADPKITTRDQRIENAVKRRENESVARQNELKVQGLERARADEDLMRQIAQETGGAPDLVLKRLRTVSPTAALKYETDWHEARKKDFDAGKAEHERERMVLDRNLGRVELAKTRPDLWPQLRAAIVADDPEMAEIVPVEYDPQKIEGTWKLGLEAKALSDREAKSFEYLVKGDYTKAAAMGFGDPTLDAQEVAQRAEAMIVQGIPREVVASFKPEQWTPDFAQRALRRGMTPNELADNDRQAAHDKHTERMAEGQLAVSQTNARTNAGTLQHRIAEDKRDRAEAQQAASGGGAVATATVDAIVANPSLFDRMPADQKAKLVPALSARGFNFEQALKGGTGGGAKGGPDVGKIMGEIETLSKRINTAAGATAGPLGFYRGLKAGANLDNDVAEYESLVVGMIPMVARAVGHTGQLTQPDVDSVRALFPVKGDNDVLAANKMARVKRLIGAGGATTAPAAAPPPPADGGTVVTLPDGRRKRFPTAAAAAAYKRDAGIP
jgi:hypothetical protein